MKNIYQKSVPGRRGAALPALDVPRPKEPPIPEKLRRARPANLPELAEVDVVRHFVGLSRLNYGVDTGFYPLGSCTMKYNPKFTEAAARLPGFAGLHPFLPQLKGGAAKVQGALAVLSETERLLCEITGLAAFTLQPLAGAHGELTGIMLMAAYHKAKGNQKSLVLVPDSAHGTNPASAAMAGYQVVSVPSQGGVIDLAAFEKALTPQVAGVMMTCPNTVGLFEPDIKGLADLAHRVDALMYYDGANLNAILGYAKPGELGFDIVHLNLHKTFATPHGGGGPGAGPVGVVERLKDYLPISLVVKRPDGTFHLSYDHPQSIGYIAPFYGNFGVLVKAYGYILALGGPGLKAVAEAAVLNANYLRVKLGRHWTIGHDRPCLHEAVFSACDKVKEIGRASCRERVS
jgi:glycine dehydrogenase subunit 2